MPFSQDEKITLLTIARKTISSEFTNSKVSEENSNSNLATRSGAFVTLTINKHLRGCIGFIESVKPLYQTVQDAAYLAAFQDYRFPPLTEKELNKIKIEISVLSEALPANSYDEIVIGKHGLIVEEMGKKGLLLPQVATENNMNREEFLSCVCNKAGLPENLWRERFLNLSLFTVEAFAE